MIRPVAWVKRAWRGEEKLWKVYWVYGIFIPWIAYLVLVYGPWQLYKKPIITYAHFEAIDYIYSLLWIVALWRCAPNANEESWMMLARIMASLFYLYLLIFAMEIFSDLEGKRYAVEGCKKWVSESARSEGISAEQFVTKYKKYVDGCIPDLMKVYR